MMMKKKDEYYVPEGMHYDDEEDVFFIPFVYTREEDCDKRDIRIVEIVEKKISKKAKKVKKEEIEEIGEVDFIDFNTLIEEAPTIKREASKQTIKKLKIKI